MSDTPRVWVTRTRPGADATARRLTAMGLKPLVSPLLRVVPLRPRLDLDSATALAFTSPNAVAAFARLAKGDAWRRLPAYTVGDATGDAARALGLMGVHSASGDLRDLVALIAARPPRGELLALGPREPSGDLPALLAPHGVDAVAVAVHATTPAPATRGRRAFAKGDVEAILIHSAKAARTLTERPPPQSHSWPPIVAISEAAAQPLLRLAAQVTIAKHADEASLLRALMQTLGKTRPPV